MDERKIKTIDLIKTCPNIINLFGKKFLLDSIGSYTVIGINQWSPQNHILANYLMWRQYFSTEPNFITELEKMLKYFLSKHPEYINSKRVLSRLKSKDNSQFQGMWSELIFAFFLKRNNVEILDLSNLIQTKNGEKELCDIQIALSDIEVTVILSKKGMLYESNGLDMSFIGAPEIDNISKTLVNRKIGKKRGKKIVAIDCTFVFDLYTKINEAQMGLDIDFNTFKETSRKILLFIRNPHTEQVATCRLINNLSGRGHG